MQNAKYLCTAETVVTDGPNEKQNAEDGVPCCLVKNGRIQKSGASDEAPLFK